MPARVVWFHELTLLCQAMLLSGREEAEVGHERGVRLPESHGHGAPVGSEGSGRKQDPGHLQNILTCAH
jgi:hypothetical protein